MSKVDGQVWQCRIGPVAKGLLPKGADLPMRDAVEAALLRMVRGLNQSDISIFSGWGEEFDAKERAVIEDTAVDRAALTKGIVDNLARSGVAYDVCAGLIEHLTGDGAVTARDVLRSMVEDHARDFIRTSTRARMNGDQK